VHDLVDAGGGEPVVTLSSRRERIEQLAALLDGTAAEDEVRGDVRRLATLAGTVTTQIELPRLDEAERDRIRTRVMAAVHTDLQEAEAARTGTARAPRSARAALATGVASVLIGTGGVAVAAQEALPGDALYGIKQATESVRIAAAGDLTEHGRLELRLATERLDEVTAAVARGGVSDQALIETLQRMDERSRSGAQTLVRVADESGEAELLEEVATFTESQARGIVDVFDDLPVQVRPHAEDSLATLRAIRDELLAPRLGTDVASAELAGAIEALLRSSPLPPAPVVVETPSSTDGRTEAPADPSTPATGSSDGTVGDAPLTDLPVDQPTTAGTPDRSVVPRLPGPLEDVGRTVDETVGGVIDGTGRLVEDTTDTVEDVVDGVGNSVGEAVDGAIGGIGGLGGSSSGS
jgi:hypothetical protein